MAQNNPPAYIVDNGNPAMNQNNLYNPNPALMYAPQHPSPYAPQSQSNYMQPNHQFNDRPNSGRKEYEAGAYTYNDRNEYPEPNSQNPYPSQVDPQVKRAVEGEKAWKGANCLDCITKLKGEPERQGFVRKVFGILAAQMVMTVGICAIVYAVEEIQDWLQENIWFYFICLGITIALSCGLVCFRKCSRTVPLNYILLFTFTFFESLMVATISSFYEAESVFLAACMALTLFTIMATIAVFTSRKPHTLAMMSYVCFGLSIVAIFFLIFFTNRYIIIIVMVILLIVTCVYVMIDIDLVTEKHGLDLDEYVIGALFLYMDLISLFLIILALTGSRSD